MSRRSTQPSAIVMSSGVSSGVNATDETGPFTVIELKTSLGLSTPHSDRVALKCDKKRPSGLNWAPLTGCWRESCQIFLDCFVLAFSRCGLPSPRPRQLLGGPLSETVSGFVT